MSIELVQITQKKNVLGEKHRSTNKNNVIVAFLNIVFEYNKLILYKLSCKLCLIKL